MPQINISILSTRLLEQEFVRDALEKGVLVDALSFIKTEALPSNEIDETIRHALGKSTAIVFTSVKAVETVGPKIDEQVSAKIFCIGYATKQAVEKYFGEESIAAVADSAKELAATIVKADVRDVTFFCGDQRREDLPALLHESNIGVNEIVVYRTIATPERIQNKYDGILFFSPSAVKSFFEENIADGETVLFAIGTTTADELKIFSKNKVVVSDVPDKRSLLDKAILYFQSNPIHH